MFKKSMLMAAVLMLLLASSAPLVMAQRGNEDNETLGSEVPLPPNLPPPPDVYDPYIVYVDSDASVSCEYVEAQGGLEFCLENGVVPRNAGDFLDAEEIGTGYIQYASETAPSRIGDS